MKTSHSTQSAPHPYLRKFSTFQPTIQKNSDVFLTQKNQKQNSQLQITERHQQLNNYIDELDSKIKKIVQYNQAQILMAYSKHFTKVREEIQLFKEEALNEVKIEASVVERMEQMKKQLIVFREQALRLFSVVLDKDKIIEHMKTKIDELESEKKYMDNRMKQIIRASKEDKVRGVTIETSDFRMNSKNNKTPKIQQYGNTFYSVGLYSYKKNKQFDKKMAERTMVFSNCRTKFFDKQMNGAPMRTNLSTSYNEQTQQQKCTQQLQLNSIVKQIYPVASNMENIIKTTAESFVPNQNANPLRNTKTVNSTQIKKTRFSLKSKSYYGRQLSQTKKSSFSGSKNRTQMQIAKGDCKRNELIQFFQRCVNMIKQQVAHRTKKATINFFTGGQAISVQDFKKIDLIKLMQMVFCDERVTNILFEAIFGTNKLSIFSQF